MNRKGYRSPIQVGVDGVGLDPPQKIPVHEKNIFNNMYSKIESLATEKSLW